MVRGGVGPEIAAALAPRQDDVMGQAVLALYRSAVQPAMARAGASLEAAAARPGLCLSPAEDHFTGSDVQRRRAAKRAGARTLVLPGLGHWWMLEDPAAGAAVLDGFWSSAATGL
jgi:pimeloyl-ACP methyl ester carboxylesterase